MSRWMQIGSGARAVLWFVWALLVWGVPADVSAQAVDQPNRGADLEDSSADATPDGKASAEKQLVFALSGYHHFPSRAELDAIADADTITSLLRGFAASSDRRPSMRTRAVDALGFYDDADTKAFLEKLIERPGAVDASERVADLLRHHAISALARAHADKALDTLEPLLESDDFQIGMTTVVALAKHGGERAHARLRVIRSQTDDEMIERQIDKYVSDAPEKP